MGSSGKPGTRRRFFCAQDLALVLIMVVGYLLTILVPRRLDRRWIPLAQRGFLWARAHRVQNLAAVMRESLQQLSAADSLNCAQDHYRLLVELWWGRFRSVGLRSWRPEIQIAGREHLDAALAKGRGVVLWRTRFTENSVFLQGLWQHGLAAVHLSNVGHGSPDRSHIGIRFAAKLYRRAEDPYVEERVLIPLDGSLAYMKVLLRRLSNNKAVSIVGENQGRQNVDGRVLGAPVAFATGAPALAWRSGAELLTAYSFRVAPFRYRIVFEPPMDVDRTLPRKEFVTECTARFCSRLERQIERYPSDWLGWQRGSASQLSALASSAS